MFLKRTKCFFYQKEEINLITKHFKFLLNFLIIQIFNILTTTQRRSISFCAGYPPDQYASLIGSMVQRDNAMKHKRWVEKQKPPFVLYHHFWQALNKNSKKQLEVLESVGVWLENDPWELRIFRSLIWYQWYPHCFVVLFKPA